MDRHILKKMLEERKQTRDRDILMLRIQKEKEEKSRLNQIWRNLLLQASSKENMGELNISWINLGDEGGGHIDSMIYSFQETFSMPLVGLRLVGVGLTNIPEEIGKYLKTLKAISFASNNLTTLPDSIAELTNLSELNLLKNKLTKLPERIGFLCSLQTLFVGNNCIEYLPITFGALNLLNRVDLECNNLKVLPENLDNMLSCTSLIVNNNQLIRLPKCISRMPSLTSLSVAHNNISYIPLELTNSKTLRTIRMSRNKLTHLPETLGDMRKLKELCIGYNNIRKLPFNFYKLTNLNILRLEGNDLLADPTPDIVAKGAIEVVKYFRQKFEENEVNRMKAIILSTLDVFRQIEERGIADPSFFEANTKVDEGGGLSMSTSVSVTVNDPWFAMQSSYFWSELLPAIKKIWHLEGLEGEGAEGTSVDSFPYDERDVNWAFTNYSDAYGSVIRREKAMFRRCACVDNSGRRQPCVPPKVGFMCYRLCTLFKAHLVGKVEKQERLWIKYKDNGVKDAIKRARHEAILFLDSKEGRLLQETVAYEKAEDLMFDRGADTAVKWRKDIAERRKQGIIRKFNRRKVRVERKRDKKAVGLQAQLAVLKDQEKAARDGYMKEKIKENIDVITRTLASLPEQQELDRLQGECEEECNDVEEEMYEEAEDSHDDGSDDSDGAGNSGEDGTVSMPSSDDDSPEADRKREKLRRKHVQELKDKRDMDKIEVYNRSKRRYKEEGAFKRRSVFDVISDNVRNLITPTPMTVIQRRKAKTMMIRSLMQIVDVVDIRFKKLYNKMNGSFEEMQKEIRYEFHYQYVSHHVTEAKVKAEREFSVIDSVRQQWAGLGLEKVFKAWKMHYFTRKQRARRDIRAAYRLETIGFHAAMESTQIAQSQVDLWQKCIDVYTDTPFWVHSVTKEKSIDRPGLEHYLPPSFEVPLPPRSLPEGFSLDTSSDESESDWAKARKGTEAHMSKLSQTLNDLRVTEGGSNKVLKGKSRSKGKDKGQKDKGKVKDGDESTRPVTAQSQGEGTDNDINDEDEAVDDINEDEHDENDHRYLLSTPLIEGSDESSYSSQMTGAGTGTGNEGLQLVAAMSPPSPNIRKIKLWSPYSIAPIKSSTSSYDQNFLLDINTLTLSPQVPAATTDTDVMVGYEYGPDSLRLSMGKVFGRAARTMAIITDNQNQVDEENDRLKYKDLYTRVALGREYMSNSQDYKAYTGKLPLALHSQQEDPELSAEVANEEFERAYRHIRKRRAKLNPIRHETYMNERIRKPRVPMTVDIPHTTTLPAITLKKSKEVETASEEYVDPSLENLLKLAGGHGDMVWRSSAEAVHLRTVLAHRALNVKKRLEEKNDKLDEEVVDNDNDNDNTQRKTHNNSNIKKKKKKKAGFFERNIAMVFKEGHYSGSSDDDEDEPDAIAAKKKKLRDKKRGERKLKNSLVEKLGV